MDAPLTAGPTGVAPGIPRPAVPGAPVLDVPVPGAPVLDVPVVIVGRDRCSGRVLLSAEGAGGPWGAGPGEDAGSHLRRAAAARSCADWLAAARHDALARMRGAFELLEAPAGTGARERGLPVRACSTHEHLALAADPARPALERAWHWLAAERQQVRAAVEEDRTWAQRLGAPGAAVVLEAGATAADGVAVEVAVLDAATGGVLLDTLLDPHVPIAPDARAAHGLADADVAGAPALADVLPRLLEATAGRTVLAHDAAAQRRLLCRSASAQGLDLAGLGGPRRWSSLRDRGSDDGAVRRCGQAPSAARRALPACRCAREHLRTFAQVPARPGTGRRAA